MAASEVESDKKRTRKDAQAEVMRTPPPKVCFPVHFLCYLFISFLGLSTPSLPERTTPSWTALCCRLGFHFQNRPHWVSPLKGEFLWFAEGKRDNPSSTGEGMKLFWLGNTFLNHFEQISKLKKKLSEAESAQASGPQPSRLQLMTFEEEVKRLKREVAQKDVELSKRDLEVNILKQKLIEAESQGIAAEKISSENSALREALEKVHKICGDVLLEE